MNPATPAAPGPPAPFHPASSPDYIPAEPLRALQSHRLREVVGRAYENVPLYRQRMHKHDLTPADIGGVDDLHRFPLTVKADLADAYPTGMFALPLQQLAGLYRPGGVSGRPIVVAYTRRDLETWTEAVVRCLASCGIHLGDVVQNTCGYNLFSDAIGVHYGADRLGATVIPVSGSDTDQQITVMKDFGVSAVCSTPSHFLHLIERAEKMGVKLSELPLRTAALVAEPWNEAVRRRIEESAGIKAYDIYGLPEIIGPGLAAECRQQDGLHLLEDHFYPEIVDPETGEVLPEGQPGELVLTTLSKQAMPMIRYRTGDLMAIVEEPCPCGRTLRRVRRLGRRSDDMVVLQGVNVFPSQIEAALRAVEGALPDYQIVLTEEDGLDQAEVRIEVTSQIFSDRIGALEGLRSRVAHEIEHALGVGLAVRLVEPNTIQRSQGRVERVVDKRGP